MKRKERANGVCNMNDKRVSVARRDKKQHLSPRGASGSLRAGGGGEKDARVAPNAITRGASSRTEARWLHKVSRVFRRTLYRTESDFLPNWPLICFRSGNSFRIGKKTVLFYTSSRRNYILFFEEKPASKLWGWAWPKLRLAWWFAGLRWHPFCTADKKNKTNQ